jgi:hypothetical protein
MQVSRSLRVQSRTEHFRLMPPPISTESVQKEGRMVLALEAFKQGHFTSFKAAARSYDVYWKTLSRRVRG